MQKPPLEPLVRAGQRKVKAGLGRAGVLRPVACGLLFRISGFQDFRSSFLMHSVEADGLRAT